MKTVGIIGGLGPETTSEFYLDLVFSCQKKEKTHRPFLIEEAKRLEKAGADFIVMPCNSLHVFIKEIRDAVDIPVLSIVEETVKFLKK